MSESAEALDLRVVFDASHRVGRVRFLMWASLLVWTPVLGLLTLSAAIRMTDDAGAPAPVVQRLAAALALTLVTLAFPLGMHLYGRCYVRRLARDRGRRLSVYETVGWWRPTLWTVREGETRAVRHHHGRIEGFHDVVTGVRLPAVRAGHTSVRVAHRRLPFVLDDRGVHSTWAEGEPLVPPPGG